MVHVNDFYCSDSTDHLARRMERKTTTVCIATNENCPLLISLKIWEEARLGAKTLPGDDVIRMRGCVNREGVFAQPPRRKGEGEVRAVRAHQLRILIMGVSLPPFPSPDDDVGSVNDYSSVDVDIARHYSFKPSSNRIESGMEMD